MMIERKESSDNKSNKFIPLAIASAVFASLQSIFAKIGLTGIESNLGTAIKTVVVLIMSWMIVFMQNKQSQVRDIDRRELMFIILSGVASGASLLCYYYAIQNGIVSVVVPIDKLSILFSVLFSYFAFGEKLTKKSLTGLLIMVAGILIIAFTA